jgi:hypothetical protein
MKIQELNNLPVIDKYKLYKKQKEAEGKGRIGPLGGNQFDSRDLDQFENEMRELESMIRKS